MLFIQFLCHIEPVFKKFIRAKAGYILITVVAHLSLQFFILEVLDHLFREQLYIKALYKKSGLAVLNNLRRTVFDIK
jgi:hypothetical protein